MPQSYTYKGLPSDLVNKDRRIMTSSPSDGDWHVYSGAYGVVEVVGRVVSISVASGADSPSSLSFENGQVVDIPAGMSIGLGPAGGLVDPVLSFNDTEMYVVEVVR